MPDSLALGLAVALLLNVLALAAALALAVRARLASRYELGLATLVLWNALVITPVYGLGLVNQLHRGRLALVSGALFLAVLGLARGRGSWRRYADDLVQGARDVASIPWVGLRRALASRSVAVVAVVFTALIVPWSAYTAYLGAAWRGWDALWYHEPIIGFAIQNHGLAFTDLPMGPAQKINGYPKLVELTQLWFVIFTDRRFVDVSNHLMALANVLAVYVLCRRFSSDAMLCLTLACVVVTMPACLAVLGSTHVDMHNGLFLIAAAHFCTRAPCRLRDAWLGAACIAMAIASKWMALPPGGVLTLIAVVRVLHAHRARRPAATALTLAGGAALILGLGATVYLRNYRAFHNPFWPELHYENERLGIHWQGLLDWGEDDYAKGVNRIVMNLPLTTLVDYLLRVPYTGAIGTYDQIFGYGVAIAWMMIPLGLVALTALVGRGLATLVGAMIEEPRWALDEETRAALWIALPLLAALKFSPAFWSPRYQSAALGLAAGVIAWLAGRPGANKLGEGVAGALGILAVISFVWTTPRWWLWPSEAARLAAIPYPEREVSPAFLFGEVDLDPKVGSAIVRDVGLARERELGPGDVVVIDELYGVYLALLWNDRFSNRVVYEPSGPDFLARVLRSRAKWLYLEYRDPLFIQASAPGSGFQLIGTMNTEAFGAVFRRAPLP